MQLARPSRIVLIGSALFVASTVAEGPQSQIEPPARPAPGQDSRGATVFEAWKPEAGGSTGTFAFEILDEAGRPIPGRITFVDADGQAVEVFNQHGAAPRELAIRDTAFHTLSGRGVVTAAPGTYTVYASRGLEWSIHKQDVTIEPGRTATFSARLRHEVDTRGWISADFHLHTLTHSGHGDANMNERIISLIGEGVELAVATDHNHHTDYDPTIRGLGATGSITAVTGNEVSVPIGHINAFPLDPNRPTPDKNARDANALFKFIRAEPNRYGVTPVIQLNHPRWGSIDYFGQAGLDPVTGRPTKNTYSADFDTLEVFNANSGWGYYDADLKHEFTTSAGLHSVLQDWFNLLNRGQRYAAVGNSDSHTVYSNLAGYPRNFVPSSTDEPGRIDVKEVAAALRKRNVFTTLGPFVEFSISGRPMGAEVKAESGAVELSIQIQAASWIDCDRVKIVVSGDVVDVIPVPQTRDVVRLSATRTVRLRRDGWIVLLVEGDDSLAPIVHDSTRPILPIAISNPIWIDADGDGVWQSPWEQAVEIVAASRDSEGRGLTERITEPSLRALAVLAAADRGGATARRHASAALGDPTRQVRLAGARAAERLADAELLRNIDYAYEAASDDPYLRISLLRAIAACVPAQTQSRALAFVDEHGDAVTAKYGRELVPLQGGRFVDQWMVAGYFPNPAPDTLITTAYGPERESGLTSRFNGKEDVEVSWALLAVSSRGYVNLRAIDERSAMNRNAIAYAQTYLYSPDPRTVRYAMGTDDGCRLWVNDKLEYEDNTRHGASPLARFGKVVLKRGWNRVLFKIENGTGGFGLYFQVFDDELTWATAPN